MSKQPIRLLPPHTHKHVCVISFFSSRDHCAFLSSDKNDDSCSTRYSTLIKTRVSPPSSFVFRGKRLLNR